jgi:hypothetical protein
MRGGVTEWACGAVGGRILVSAKTFRAWRPEQAWLLPPSPREWLPEGHLVDFLMDVVRELDLTPITDDYERELRDYYSDANTPCVESQAMHRTSRRSD